MYSGNVNNKLLICQHFGNGHGLTAGKFSYPRIFLQNLRKTISYLSQDNWSLNPDLKPRPPE
jgi:hypothetical protein